MKRYFTMANFKQIGETIGTILTIAFFFIMFDRIADEDKAESKPVEQKSSVATTHATNAPEIVEIDSVLAMETAPWRCRIFMRGCGREVFIALAGGVDSVAPLGNGSYELYDEWGRCFTTMQLPADSADIPRFTAAYSRSYMPVDSFLAIGRSVDHCAEEGLWEEARQIDSSAYRLIMRMDYMGSLECSPANDLNFARAAYTLMREDPAFASDTTKFYRSFNKIISKIDGSGTASDMTYARSLVRLLTSMRLSLAYEKMINRHPQFMKEYVAWHELMQSITCYYDFISANEDHYLFKSMDDEIEKKGWLDKRLELLLVETDVLDGRKSTIDIHADSLLTESDVRQMARLYHTAKQPAAYSPIYYELLPAFERWLAVRRQIATTLSGRQREAYDAVTAHTVSLMASLACSLNNLFFVPALDRE